MIPVFPDLKTTADPFQGKGAMKAGSQDSGQGEGRAPGRTIDFGDVVEQGRAAPERGAPVRGEAEPDAGRDMLAKAVGRGGLKNVPNGGTGRALSAIWHGGAETKAPQAHVHATDPATDGKGAKPAIDAMPAPGMTKPPVQRALVAEAEAPKPAPVTPPESPELSPVGRPVAETTRLERPVAAPAEGAMVSRTAPSDLEPPTGPRPAAPSEGENAGLAGVPRRMSAGEAVERAAGPVDDARAASSRPLSEYAEIPPVVSADRDVAQPETVIARPSAEPQRTDREPLEPRPVAETDAPVTVGMHPADTEDRPAPVRDATPVGADDVPVERADRAVRQPAAMPVETDSPLSATARPADTSKVADASTAMPRPVDASTTAEAVAHPGAAKRSASAGTGTPVEGDAAPVERPARAPVEADAPAATPRPVDAPTTAEAVAPSRIEEGAARVSAAAAPVETGAHVADTAIATRAPEAIAPMRSEERPVRIRDSIPVDSGTVSRPTYASADRFAPRASAPHREASAPRVQREEADPYSLTATMNEQVSTAEAAQQALAATATPAPTTTPTAATPAQTGAMALAAPMAMAMPVSIQDASSMAASGDAVEAVGDSPLGLVSRGGDGGTEIRQPVSSLRPTTADGADALQEIVRAAVVTKGPTTIELRLDPSELGKIDIELSFNDDRVSIMVRGERDDALDLMRRSSDELGRMLRQAGLDLDTLGFSREQAGDRGREGAFRTVAVEMPGELTGDTEDMAYSAARPGVARDRVDIRI